MNRRRNSFGKDHGTRETKQGVLIPRPERPQSRAEEGMDRIIQPVRPGRLGDVEPLLTLGATAKPLADQPCAAKIDHEALADFQRKNDALTILQAQGILSESAAFGGFDTLRRMIYKAMLR